MACFYPLPAWQRKDGSIAFKEPADSVRALTLPCGQCVGCRLERSRQWAVRILHEARMHENSVFVTLTYDPDKLKSISLVYRDFQKFMRRLRASRCGQNVRFFMCGEYGDLHGRPHFHACLFGVFFDDREFYRELPSGFKIYRSAELERLWPHGYSSVADVSFESAAYVARYCMKKVTGNNAAEHYKRVDWRFGDIVEVEPEFCKMSLKPGIGYPWFEKYGEQVYPVDYVIVNGRKVKPPRAYDKWLKKNVDQFSELTRIDVETSRLDKAALVAEDNTADRLAVREAVTKARLKFKLRGLDNDSVCSVDS